MRVYIYVCVCKYLCIYLFIYLFLSPVSMEWTLKAYSPSVCPSFHLSEKKNVENGLTCTYELMDAYSGFPLPDETPLSPSPNPDLLLRTCIAIPIPTACLLIYVLVYLPFSLFTFLSIYLLVYLPTSPYFHDCNSKFGYTVSPFMVRTDYSVTASQGWVYIFHQICSEDKLLMFLFVLVFIFKLTTVSYHHHVYNLHGGNITPQNGGDSFHYLHTVCKVNKQQ